jgi:hypothetical protein
MSFDPSLTFAGGYLTSSVINYFKIVDTDGNPICGASSASVNGSIAPYNGDYTQIRADQGWSPEDLGSEDIAAQYFGQAMNISINASDEEIAFKFKDASTGTLYNVTVTGDFNGVAFTNAAKVPVKESTAGGQYGGLGTLFGQETEPIVFTVDLSGGGGGGDDGSFDPNLTFAGGYLTSSVINYFKIVDTAGNPICGASSASVNGSIAPYNGDYTQIRADQGWSPEDLGTEDIAAQYFGQAMNISINASDEEIAFKFKDASTGTLYNVTVTGDFNGVAFTNAAKVPVKESTAGGQYGGLGTLFGQETEPIVFTVDLSGGGGSVAAPTLTDTTFTTITGLVQGTSATTTETLASIFTGDGISYTYSVTGSGVSAATSGDKVQVTADSGAAEGDYTVTVTATNDGGTATSTISVTVVLANLVPTVSTPFPNLSFGKSTSAGSYVIENVLSHFTDADNAPNPLSISSVSVTSGTNVSVSNDNSADTITIDYAANPDLGSATIKVTATDGADSVDATFTSTITETKGIYLWTYQDTANNYTTIKMKITTEVIKVPGIHLKYSATSGLSFPDQETTSPVGGGSASAYSSSGWQQSHVNSDTATPYIVLFGDASKALGSGDYDLAYFESLFTISDIVGISDQHGNLVNANNYALSEPPIIFEDTTRDPATDILYGDVNVSESLNAHDLTMLAKYLVGNDEEYTGESGAVKAVTYVNGKIADNNDTYAWIDVNKNGEIDVGDACRLAEKLADADFNIIGDRDK